MTYKASVRSDHMALTHDDQGFYTLTLDNPVQRQNTLSQAVLAELADVLEHLADQQPLKGLIICSAKEDFIAGADVREFHGLFQQDKDSIIAALMQMHEIFNALENLPCPTVALIRGAALGGGLELALACDYRLASADAVLGLPEVRLGIHPGWGGCVRLPRLAGLDNALEWLTSGRRYSAGQAQQLGVLDGVLDIREMAEALKVAVNLLGRVQSGELDMLSRRARKALPLTLSSREQLLSFNAARALVAAKTGSHYPAPFRVLDVVQKSASLARDPAQEVEAMSLAELAHHPVTAQLVGVFLKEQAVKKAARTLSRQAAPAQQLAVLGAGVMGTGIAAQAALKNTQVVLRDISPAALQSGQARLEAIFNQVAKYNHLSREQIAQTRNNVLSSLHLQDCATADIAVEAVSEDPAIKLSVLKECEALLAEEAVLCTNTSTLSVSELARQLRRPEHFCGMHFFNPVARMPLVEIIRGQASSDTCISRAVAQTLAMGKTPVVVNDCPGFLVNRVLFPYLLAADQLISQGVDPYQLDALMQAWGWPMGPARLLDQIGLDIASHAGKIMAHSYPQRMKIPEGSAIRQLFSAGQLGLKTGSGFYLYPKGEATQDEQLAQRLGLAGFSEASEERVLALMLPMAFEAWRCLEEGIVASPAEADLAFIYGLGFPAWRGGLFSWLDTLEAAQLSRSGQEIPPGLAEHKATARLFYPQARMGGGRS